jgi:hypothetical protein
MISQRTGSGGQTKSEIGKETRREATFAHRIQIARAAALAVVNREDLIVQVPLSRPQPPGDRPRPAARAVRLTPITPANLRSLLVGLLKLGVRVLGLWEFCARSVIA